MVRQSYGGVTHLRKSTMLGIDAQLDPNEAWWKRDLRGMKFFLTPMNLLLVFVPIGLFVEMDAEYLFAANFLAIMPIASIIFTSIEIVGEHAGPTRGGLIDAFLGKAVEQMMCVQCMRAGLVQVLQGNLMGSLHWNLLLVLGMSIFVSGVKQTTTDFKAEGASAQMSCQIVASISIALPTMFKSISSTIGEAEVLYLSRIIAFVTMLVYMLFLFFHFHTHVEAFHDDKLATMRSMTEEDGDGPSKEDTVDKVAGPVLTAGTSITLMTLSIITCGCSSQQLVNTIPDVSAKFGVPKAFIGVTLLPIIGNTAEHLAALTCAREGEMDLVIDIAVGSATQLALFVIPGAVLWGWLYGMPMTMDFRNFDATVMLLSTFLVSQVLQHGKTNWLHGAMLMTTYTLIAIISWFIPE